MKIRKHTLVIGAMLLMGGVYGCGTTPSRRGKDTVLQVCFSPKGNCTQLVQETIARAQKTILVQAYYFTSLPIAKALINAHRQGITVRVLIDRSQLKYPYTQVYYMAQKGIPISVDRTSGIAHNKVMIIDDDYVLTGSFNWTRAAEDLNTENLILIKGKKTNQVYKEAWYQRAQKARKLVVD